MNTVDQYRPWQFIVLRTQVDGLNITGEKFEIVYENSTVVSYFEVF